MGGEGEVGEHSWPHVVEFATDRVGDGEGRVEPIVPTGKERGVLSQHETPGDRFVVTARGHGAPPRPDLDLLGRQYGADTALGRGQRGGRQRIKAGQACNFLNTVGRLLEVEPPTGRSNIPGVSGILDRAAEFLEQRLHFCRSDGQPRKSRHVCLVEGDGALPVWGCACNGGMGDVSAAGIENDPGCSRQSVGAAFGVNAAFEPVSRIRCDSRHPAGARGAERVKPGGFDEHIRGFIADGGGLAAHDAAEADNAGFVGDDAHFLGEFVGLAVQCREGFPRLAEPR